MSRYGEVKQSHHLCHHGDTICHPKSGYVTNKLHGTSTRRCNNNAIFSDIAMFTFPAVYVCRQRESSRCEALHWQFMPNWKHGSTVELIIFRV